MLRENINLFLLRHNVYKRVGLSIYIVLTFFNFIWRLYFAIHDLLIEENELKPYQRLMPLIFLFMEFFFCIPTMLIYAPFWAVVKPVKQPPWSMGEQTIEEKFPLVDIFVAYCGEPCDILLDTVKSGQSLNYPKHKYRLWVLDDGKDESTEKKIKDLADQCPTSCMIQYVHRFKEQNKPHYYKAGNINSGVSEVKRRVGRVGDYVLIQDVDMLIHPNIFLKMLPYFQEDQRLAYIQVPQHLYNLHSSDVLCQGLIGQSGVMRHCDSNDGASTCIGKKFLPSSCNGIFHYRLWNADQVICSGRN